MDLFVIPPLDSLWFANLSVSMPIRSRGKNLKVSVPLRKQEGPPEQDSPSFWKLHFHAKSFYGSESKFFIAAVQNLMYTIFARLPSVLCVGTAQKEKGGLAMRKFIFLLIAVALVLLLTSDAM